MKVSSNERIKKIFFYALAVASILAVLLCIILNIGYIKGVFLTFLSALKPILYAVVTVFCVNGIIKWYASLFSRIMPDSKKGRLWLKVISVLLGYFTLILIIVALAVIVILPLINSYSDISGKIPDYIEGAKNWLTDIIKNIPVLSDQSDKIMTYIEESLNLSYGSISKYAPKIVEYVNRIMSEASSIFLGLMISIYIVCSFEYINRVRYRIVHAFMTDEKAQKTHDYIVSVCAYFSDFFSGRLLYSLIVGIVFYLVLWLMNIPMFYFISIMIGILCVVPVAGTVIAFGISLFFVFITAYESVALFSLVYIAVMLVLYHFVEKNIVRKSARPTVTASLIAVLVMYGFFGVSGAIFAVPVYLSVRLTVKNVFLHIEKVKEKSSIADDDNDEIEDIG